VLNRIIEVCLARANPTSPHKARER
jgi:hypothetical protein